MKLRRFMQIAFEDEPTKGQRCALQQNWPADDAMGQKPRWSLEPVAGLCPLRPESGQV